MSKKNKKQRNALYGPIEIGNAAIAAEEIDITYQLDTLATRIKNLPGVRNDDSPSHRVKGICYRIWAESLTEVKEYIRTKLRQEYGITLK